VETLRADQQVGGRYPPSASDDVENPYQVANPYRQLGGQDAIDISGAGLLVWALAGADRLGTPGFRTFRSASSYWAQDTDEEQGGAYELDDNMEARHPRAGPFVDLSSVELTRWNPNAVVTGGGQGSFEIAIEAEAAEARGERPWGRNYPMFLDAFGGPFLYYRADRAGFRIADRSQWDNQAQGNQRGIYHFRDNSALVDPDTPNAKPLMLTPSGKRHRLAFEYDAPVLPDDISLENPNQYNFVAYIRDTGVEARVEPQKKDSFLLISAGADGVFGTGDDVANFEHNGAELREP
jgi:hypothetical protein